MKTCKYGCGKMKSGGKVATVKKITKSGTTKKYAMGGNTGGYAPAQKGGDNTKMGIYGIPNAGRTDSLGFKKGGSLKPVPTDKVGLAKLPTAVRNKMGFQKKGGAVKKK